MQLTRNEKRVLKLLVDNAKLSDISMANKLNISGQAVGKIRHYLEQNIIKKYTLTKIKEKALEYDISHNQIKKDELLDKINRDIEIWKGSNEDDEHLPVDQYDFSRDLDKNSDFEPTLGFNEIPSSLEDDDFSPNLANSEEKNTQNEEDDEDRYYFEPVE